MLLVDDEADVLALMAATLRSTERYELLLATNGEEALSVATQEKPDLVILDVVMPLKSGWDVCHALKSDEATREIPVIVLTALAQVAHQEQAMSLGVADYLTKPFSPAMLRQKVEGILGR